LSGIDLPVIRPNDGLSPYLTKVMTDIQKALPPPKR
jgi:hypothetical protein